MAELSPERRILLAFALSFLVFLLWAAYMKEKYPSEPTPPEAAPVTSPAQASAPSPPPVYPERKRGTSPPPPLTVAVHEDTQERTFTVETDVATVVLSNRGAVLQSLTLKNYHNDRGEPLELVQGRLTGLGYPLSLALADPEKEDKLNNALFVPDSRVQTPQNGLLFEWSDGTLLARKRFRFNAGYTFEVETLVLEAGQPLEHRLAWRGGFGELAGPASSIGVVPAQVFFRAPDGVHRQLARDAGHETGWLWKSSSPFPYNGEASYAGIEDQYFAAVFIPQQPRLSVAAWTRDWTPPEQKKPVAIGVVATGTAASPNGNRFRVFVGPKALDVLEGLDVPALSNGAVPLLADELVDYGWFWWIAKPLFWALTWVHEKWISNYGWAIVLLTILINIELFPFKWASMGSAWKMQKLSPQMRAIQARYKQYKFNDPRKQQMQQEIMALYKEHGVNPLGGCLPMLLQIPFFFGFYKVLAYSIELRQAPWFGWITDLSRHDPYFILPVLMTASMYISTRMTPMTATDPVQQKMMRMMPLIFGFLFLWVSSGLVLYWMTSNVVGIGQQWFINQRQRQRELAEKLAVKERKKKKRHGQETTSS
ncbi:MAG: membrane protein insertase YidC [Acidobacteria bacterium]|nr:membrane protein insertase YidC [Acidobacteriota bacterium]